MKKRIYFVKYRQWLGDKWGDWINCYTKQNPYNIFDNHFYQVRILWSNWE